MGWTSFGRSWQTDLACCRFGVMAKMDCYSWSMLSGWARRVVAVWVHARLECLSCRHRASHDGLDEQRRWWQCMNQAGHVHEGRRPCLWRGLCMVIFRLELHGTAAVAAWGRSLEWGAAGRGCAGAWPCMWEKKRAWLWLGPWPGGSRSSLIFRLIWAWKWAVLGLQNRLENGPNRQRAQ